MWLRFVLLSLLVFVSWPASAQLLGNLNDYPKLLISMHYQPPEGSANEGMQFEWQDQPSGGQKVTGTVQPLKAPTTRSAALQNAAEKPVSSWVTGELPETAIAPIFNEVRSLTALFRIPASSSKTRVSNEQFTLGITHPNLDVDVVLVIQRNDPAAWNAAATLWSHLRATMPSNGKDLIHDHR
ncbi:hypothetical protein CfE428DRAFT_1484 [Chthoniobacter flavus Ellin428]|uniref:Uncharacterized protein n=1 Tax=Chthoniobacter flavus Ellin428 TaxID=497964 RepID=B4CY43_9BACT|nr:hypothetical protein [Chthoniobacter flavus]EDY21191.1 hypothetical protein CfE428DRAFT_1484 [Chthoniobacter flavus Ellin428]TCO87561.1 hypothetical protein EV701_12163 [Chthoniobacter flavus]